MRFDGFEQTGLNAEIEAMQATGLEPMDVLVAATANGARALGRADDLGTVETGKIADLLVLAADPTADVVAFRQLTHVVRGGLLRPVGELARPAPWAALPPRRGGECAGRRRSRRVAATEP